MIRCRIFALAVLPVLFAAPCAGVCTGWAASADERMACCVGKSAEEATMCCASAEGRQNADWPAALVVALPASETIALKIASALAPEPRAVSVIKSHDPLATDSKRYVLLSVFLI
jgi:hypothetical protein